MIKGQTSIRAGIEDILFPMETCNITQGDNGSLSHRGAYATDLAGKDTGRDYAYFPFSAKSVFLDSAKNGNAVIWESLKPVRFADGVIDHCCLLVVHDNDSKGFEVGKTYKQGEQMAQEGTAGRATGNHLHLEFARGKFTGKAYEKNAFGVYELPNNRPIETCCFMDNTTIIRGTAAWKYLKDIPAAIPSEEMVPKKELLKTQAELDRVLNMLVTANQAVVTMTEKYYKLKAELKKLAEGE